MAEQQVQIALNTRTVDSLIEQVDLMLNQTDATANQMKALENLKLALEGVLPYVPQPPQVQTDELTLEKDIRKEIIIAGANENG